jgi:NADH-quinone oxidoreductase subunit C
MSFGKVVLIGQIQVFLKMINKNKIYLLRELFPEHISSIYVHYGFGKCRDVVVIILKNRNASFIKFLSSSYFYNFSFFVDEYASDNLFNFKRFKVFSYFRSFETDIFLINPISFSSNTVETLSNNFPGSIWAEREIYDLYGIYFYAHPDLRRILTDYGFSGFPLRKDFPLSGYIQVRYDEISKSVVTEPVELTQEYRFFEFNNPWIFKNNDN